MSGQLAARTALTMVLFAVIGLFPSTNASPDDAEYKAASLPNMTQEFATWTALLSNQAAPGLHNNCSYITKVAQQETELYGPEFKNRKEQQRSVGPAIQGCFCSSKA